MKCPNCKTTLEFALKKIPFRATCPSCDRDLHTCENCTHYSPGKPNDCRVPDTLFVRDRTKYNFCEDFSLKEKKVPKASNSDSFDKLFNDEKAPPPKKSFDDLFK